MAPLMTTTPRLLLAACVALALARCGSAETFPSSPSDRTAVVAPVVAARTEDLEPQTLSRSSSSASSSSASSTAASEASSGAEELSQFLRGSGSFGSRGSVAGADVTIESEPLPGGANGFGRVTYDDDASSKIVASALGGMRAGESQAAYRARIRKAQRAAERKNPDLRLQNLVAF